MKTMRYALLLSLFSVGCFGAVSSEDPSETNPHTPDNNVPAPSSSVSGVPAPSPDLPVSPLDNPASDAGSKSGGHLKTLKPVE